MMVNKTIHILAFCLALLVIGCTPGNKNEQNQGNTTAGTQPGSDKGDKTPPSNTISDKELENFARATEKIEAKQQQLQQEMLELIKDEGMEVSTFYKMMEVQQQNGMKDGEYAKQEIEKFHQLSDQLETLNETFREDMAHLMNEEYNMDKERFQEISMAVQQDTTLQKRFQQLIMSEGNNLK